MDLYLTRVCSEPTVFSVNVVPKPICYPLSYRGQMPPLICYIFDDLELKNFLKFLIFCRLIFANLYLKDFSEKNQVFLLMNSK